MDMEKNLVLFLKCSDRVVDKKFKVQKRLKSIKNNTTLETLTKKDTIYKKFTYPTWANNKFQKIFKDFNITLTPINPSSRELNAQLVVI